VTTEVVRRLNHRFANPNIRGAGCATADDRTIDFDFSKQNLVQDAHTKRAPAKIVDGQ
jgi:hypothetical protein